MKMFGKKKKHDDDAWEIVDDDYTDMTDASPVQTQSPPPPPQYFGTGDQMPGQPYRSSVQTGQMGQMPQSQSSTMPSEQAYYQDVAHVVDGDTESTGLINSMEEKEKLLGEKKKKGLFSRFRKRKPDDEMDEDDDEDNAQPVYDTSDMLGRDYLHEPGAELEHDEDEDEPYGMYKMPVKKLIAIGVTAFAAIIIGLGVFNTDFRNGHAYIVPLDVHYEREYINRSDDVYDYLMKLADELPEQAQALPNDYISMSNKIQDEKDTLKSKTDKLSRYTNVPKTLNAYHSKLLNLSILTQEYLQNLLDNYTHSDYMAFAESGYSDFTNALADIHTLRVQINSLIHRNIDGSADTSGLTTGSDTGSTANDDSTASGARTTTDSSGSGNSGSGNSNSTNSSGSQSNGSSNASGTTGSSAVTEIPNINAYSREDADNANGAQAASNVQKTGEQITSPYSSYNSSASSSGGSSGNGNSKKNNNANSASNGNANSNNSRTPSFGEQAQAASDAAASNTQSALDMTNTNNTAVNDAMGGNMAAGMGM